VISEHFQVITFTASDQSYADAILDYIDPHHEYIDYRLYRHNCVPTEFGFVKDLRVIRNRSMQNMVLIDNSALSFIMQVDNGIPILPFYEDKKDEELQHLLYYLNCLKEAKDVRKHNRDAFGLFKIPDMSLSQVLGEEPESQAMSTYQSQKIRESLEDLRKGMEEISEESEECSP